MVESPKLRKLRERIAEKTEICAESSCHLQAAKKSFRPRESVPSRAPPALTLSAPVHQLQQYYRLGSLDNCGGKWRALVNCLTLKTKSSTELQEILEAREKAKVHIWTFRTPEEASSYWTKQYGYFGYVVKEKKNEKKRKSK